MAHFIFIRLRLFYRNLAAAGWGLMLVAVLLMLGPLLAFFAKIFDTPSLWWGLALAAPILSWHFKRTDGRFLKKLDLPLRPVLWLEYALASLPAAALLLASSNFGGLALLIGIVGVLPFLPLRDRKSGESIANFDLNWLPDWAFEWRAGIRRMGYGFWVFWLCALAGSWWIGTLPLFGFLWGLMILSLYESVEPKEILQRHFARPADFWTKMARQTGLSCAFLLPHALLFLLFNAHYWYFLLAIFGFAALTTGFSMACKYAVWHPGRRRVEQSLLSGLFVFFTVSAIFTPVALGWFAWKSLAASRRLRLYFSHDHA